VPVFLSLPMQVEVIADLSCGFPVGCIIYRIEDQTGMCVFLLGMAINSPKDLSLQTRQIVQVLIT